MLFRLKRWQIERERILNSATVDVMSKSRKNIFFTVLSLRFHSSPDEYRKIDLDRR